MEHFIVHPARALEGEIPVRGAKNAVLKAMAASLLFDTPVELTNMPQITDVAYMQALLAGLGVLVEKTGKRSMRFFVPADIATTLDKDIAKSLRSSIVLAGPLLARAGAVTFPYPGGCVIGKRPIDLFLQGFQQLGARVHEAGGHFTLRAKHLKGADIFFRVVSVTATETLMMAAVRAEGTTVLRNAAREPEIPALAAFLNSCGARITGAGTDTVTIRGVKHLGARRRRFHIPPDRIEAGSFAILAALRGKRVRVTQCVPEHLRSLFAALAEAGVAVRLGPTWFEIKAPKRLRALNVQTREYPGFATDFQAPFMVLLTQAKGISLMLETIYEGRLEYVNDLNRMGADIMLCDPHRAIVHGPTPLSGRTVESPDLRAGLAFMIAALVAAGSSEIRAVHHIDRGYERVEERLRHIGADVHRAADDEKTKATPTK